MEIIEVEIIRGPIAVETETGGAAGTKPFSGRILGLRRIGPQMPFSNIGSVITRARQNMTDAITHAGWPSSH